MSTPRLANHALAAAAKCRCWHLVAQRLRCIVGKEPPALLVRALSFEHFVAANVCPENGCAAWIPSSLKAMTNQPINLYQLKLSITKIYQSKIIPGGPYASLR